ncbi:conjugal transfer mating pair stabilization protein TraG [Brevundimonas nasdae]|uniref:conjugal transfer protein TraG N-terminal domain-containing protein n=1 Tax=Brevundimonas nasdae TaxID=172043 RepID=UPI001913FA19|nr:conjugal transfer protein TraG N-terminal domain-containing protein [Brevundimonas nasdae]MBK6026805.1 conjugal transfer protein TraG N-terminal domain-containing protein [Brevundimonas nasdae]MDQ0453388.1 conjugal transfer mating pair stabilization protein TraG [Brevundimonas nasdae]
MHEIVVYGGGAIYRDVLQGVALMSGANGLSTLLRIAMLLGLIITIFKMAFDLDVKSAFKWFLTSMVIFNLMWVPKAQVHITDRFDPSLTGADVANVPIALAVVSSITFKVGDRVTKLAEQAYSQPADVAYTKTGMIFGAKVFERLRTAQISDPRFDQNLRSFVKGCIYYDLLEGHYTAGELARQNDLWTYVTVTRGTNPGRSLEYVNTSGSSDIISCTTAAQRLNSEWNATLSSSISLFQKRLRPELPESQLQSAFLQEMGALHPMMVGASRDATNTFQQVLMINAVRRGVPGFSAEAGNDAMGVFAETQAELHTRNQQRLMGGVAEKAVPLLKILTELLILGIFPVIFPAMLLPGMTMRIMQGYFGGFLYLQLWGPMYVILHTIMMWKSAVDTAAATYIPGATAGLKLANLEAVSGLNAEIASLAGYLSLSIPVLASTIAFAGAAAVGKGGESFMASFRGGAEAAAGTATTGNVSIGNTAYANHSFNNLSGMRQSTSAELDFGRTGYVDSGLNRIETNADGSVSVTKAAQSQTAVNVRHSEGISAAAVQAASERRQESVDLRHSLTEGKSRAQSESTEFVQQWMSGTSSTWTQGRDNRETWGATEQQMDSQAQTLSRNFGIQHQDAKAIVAATALEAYGQAGLSSGIFKQAGIDVSAGGKLSMSASGSRSSTASETDALNAARSSLSSQSFTDRFDQSAANYASEAFAKTQSASTSEALKRSDTFTSTRSITDAMDRSEGLARSYEQRADLTRSQGASAEINYANAFEGYAINQLVGRRDAYGVEIDADRARGILAGHSMADMSLVHEVTGSFHKDMATRIDTPELIGRNQNLAPNAEAANPGPVRLLQEGTGASLRTGLGRGSEGRPGEGFRMDDPELATPNTTPSQSTARPSGSGLRSMEIQPPEAAAPGPGWAGPSALQPGFSSPLRDSIRGDTAAVGEALAARRTPDFAKGGGRAFGEVFSDVDPKTRVLANATGALFDREGAHPQGHQASQNAGGRLGRRYREQ